MGEALHDSQPEQALEAFQQAQDIAGEVSCRLVTGLALLGAGSTLMRLGRLEESGRQLRESVLYWRQAGNVILQWTSLPHVAEFLARFDHADTARRILVSADSDDRAPRAIGEQAERLATLQKKQEPGEQLSRGLDEVGEEAIRALTRILQGLEQSDHRRDRRDPKPVIA